MHDAAKGKIHKINRIFSDQTGGRVGRTVGVDSSPYEIHGKTYAMTSITTVTDRRHSCVYQDIVVLYVTELSN